MNSHFGLFHNLSYCHVSPHISDNLSLNLISRDIPGKQRTRAFIWHQAWWGFRLFCWRYKHLKRGARFVDRTCIIGLVTDWVPTPLSLSLGRAYKGKRGKTGREEREEREAREEGEEREEREEREEGEEREEREERKERKERRSGKRGKRGKEEKPSWI